MANVDVETETVEAEATILKVPVVKGKSYLEVSPNDLPEHVYREVILQGLKVLLNRGQTKITKGAYPDAEDLKAAAMEAAETTLQNMYDGKIRVTGGAKSDKIPREVMTEARRIARNLVKEELKKAGVKVSYVESSEITKAANALLATDPTIIAEAQEEVEKRAKKKVKIDIGTIPLSEKRMKAAEAKRADKTVSAAKAGKIATRARPGLHQ
jgi:hypothetical protein